ncbi:MAG: efflux RND transporter periplasmic adaptor subunit [Planctomycetota bacterium]
MSSTDHDLTKLRIERARPRRPTPRWVWVVAAGVLALLAWFVLPWAASALDRRPEVSVVRVPRPGASEVSGTAANGYVVARREAALSTDIQGRIVELRVSEGDSVEEGDLIARLDTRQLEASLERTLADLETTRATAALARLDHERKEPLLTTGDISQAAVDEARAKRAEAEATVASLQAAVREIEIMIEKSSVFAPFSGVITSKNAEVGEVVSSVASGINTRGSVATLVDFDTLEVQVELAQTSLQAARVGAEVRVVLDAYPDDGYPGRVRQIWPTADRQKATVELRVEFLERDERILPEMGVRVVFVPESRSGDGPPTLSVPERTVADEAVWLVEDGRVRRLQLQLGTRRAGGRREVLSGLSGGETLVLDPPAALKDGDEVRVRDATN